MTQGWGYLCSLTHQTDITALSFLSCAALACSLTSLSLSFPVWKTMIRKGCTPQGWEEGAWRQSGRSTPSRHRNNGSACAQRFNINHTGVPVPHRGKMSKFLQQAREIGTAMSSISRGGDREGGKGSRARRWGSWGHSPGITSLSLPGFISH